MIALASNRRPRLVVVGCGFGGYSLLSRLPVGKWDVTLVSPRSYLLFTPLLASAAVGTVAERSIVEPARRRLRRVRVLDARAREVVCRGAHPPGDPIRIPYDRLVIAVGARVGDHGVPGVGEHASTLQSITDARVIRRRLLERVASADLPGLPPDEAERRSTFVVCGGGPTGVELAAGIHDLLADDARTRFPRAADRARVVLVEATGRILSGFDEALGRYARHHFRRAGIEVRTSARVEEVCPSGVRIAHQEPLPAGLVVWAGGNTPVDLVERLGEPTDDRGRLRIDDRLRLENRRDVYALGDCASSLRASLPATAQVAERQGRYLARAFRDPGRDPDSLPPFEYRGSGMLAYIGGGRALADLPRGRWSGRAAWVLWRSAYLTKLVGLANKASVLFDWSRTGLSGRDLSPI